VKIVIGICGYAIDAGLVCCYTLVRFSNFDKHEQQNQLKLNNKHQGRTLLCRERKKKAGAHLKVDSAIQNA